MSVGDHPLRDVPEHWLAPIVHYVTGLHNISSKELSEPIIKPALANIYPIFILQYGLLSISGLMANMYIIYYIMRYRLYRDVTHAFLMNLGLCHFVQCGIVMPMTLMVIIIQNWIFGQFLCFFLPLLQDIPLHVALISHLLIAWDRMRWLGDPLKGRLPSFVCSCATWLTGMVIALPYPIYTTYLDLGLYMPKFRGVGICIVNLVDDMQEYMRGLFVIMYCAPATILAYLYIRTSRELRPPEGPLGVMMFEHRADVRNRQRTSSTPSATRTGTRTSCARSYDLYDAELDVTREKRTQRHLGAMAATQIICTCPLMILRIARMVLVETYENTAHFDITYLMFVWIAFLPTVINPCIYASWVLSRVAKERLRGYLRLSTKRFDKKPQQSTEDSVTQENTATDTVDDSNSQRKSTTDEVNTRCASDLGATLTSVTPSSAIKQKQSKINSSADSKPTAVKTKNVEQFSAALRGRLKSSGLLDSNGTINNSCSNITSSTYCNGFIDLDAYHDKSNTSDRDSLVSVNLRKPASRLSSERSRDFLSDIDIMSRRESSSTYERDMEIIDLLERERSMDIQDMMERERKGEKIRSISRKNSSSVERHHRILPDISKFTAPNSPKKIDAQFNIPATYTHQSIDVGPTVGVVPLTEMHIVPIGSSNSGSVGVHRHGSRHSSSGSFSKRDSVDLMRDDDTFSSAPIKNVVGVDISPRVYNHRAVETNRISRTRSSGSSTKSRHSSRLGSRGSNDYRESPYSQNL